MHRVNVEGAIEATYVQPVCHCTPHLLTPLRKSDFACMPS
jgi:hypothetical protein